MDTVLWVTQAIVALAMLASGVMKMVTPRDRLIERMGWASDFSANQIRFFGIIEVLGGLGLVAPPALGILPILTPIAATGLLVVMAGAAVTHARRGEKAMIMAPVVLGALCAVIAIGRFVWVPF